MPCYHIPNGTITIPNIHSITLPSGKKIQFEFHDYMGPVFLRKDGGVMQRIPSEVWTAFDKWYKRYKRRKGKKS